jgi:hypothetical protein
MNDRELLELAAKPCSLRARSDGQKIYFGTLGKDTKCFTTMTMG